jgi:hypothetical protein
LNARKIAVLFVVRTDIGKQKRTRLCAAHQKIGNSCIVIVSKWDRDSSVGIGTRFGFEGPGIES